MPHDDRHEDADLDTSTGVGTDGSLRSPNEGVVEHGADHSSDLADGVGTDGSLVNPEQAVADPDEPDYARRDPN
jgi:hypothetical protein